MVVAVAKAAEAGARAIVCASTGNTSASAAAYGAAAGMEVIVVLPKGQIALGKLLQALVAGARVVAIDGNFDQALAIVRGARRTGRPSRDPRQLGQSVPPRGPEDRRLRDLRRPRPRARRARHPGRQRRQHQRLLGRASASTRRPGSSARRRGCGGSRRRVRHRSWSATGSSTRRPSRRRSGSAIRPRGPRRSRRATRPAGGSPPSPTRRSSPPTARWPGYEGIFCEPASAASVAGVTKAAAAGELDPDATVVCVLTGHGLKDPTTAERQVPPFLEADPTWARSPSRSAGRRDDGRPLARRTRWQPGHRRGARRRRPTSAPATTAWVSPWRSLNRIELEVRVWSRGEIELTVEGEGRNELSEDRENRFVRGLEAALDDGPGRAPRGRRLADLDAQPDPARARARVVGRRDGRRGRWPATPSRASRCRRPRCCSLASEIEGHPDNAAAALLGGFVVSATDADGVEAIRFDCAARPARGAVHPGAPPADRRDARSAARLGPAGRRGRQPRRGGGRRGRPRDRPVRPARPADRRSTARAVPRGGLPAAAPAGRGRARTPARSGRACRAPVRRSWPSPNR